MNAETIKEVAWGIFQPLAMVAGLMVAYAILRCVLDGSC